MAIINRPRTVSEAIDMLIQSMKTKGVSKSSYQYTEFLNLKKDLIGLKMLFGYATVNKDSLEFVRKEFLSDYSPYAASIERRRYVLHVLLDFIDSVV